MKKKLMKVLVRDNNGDLTVKEIGKVCKSGEVVARDYIPQCYDVDSDGIVKPMSSEQYARYTRISDATTDIYNILYDMPEDVYQFFHDELKKIDEGLDLADYLEKEAELIKNISSGNYVKKEKLKPATIDWILRDEANDFDRYTKVKLNKNIEFAIDCYDHIARMEVFCNPTWEVLDIIEYLTIIKTILLQCEISANHPFLECIRSEISYLKLSIRSDSFTAKSLL